MKKHKKVSSEIKVETLAQLIQQLRELRGITRQRLADLAQIPVNQLEDIESGIELFLSPATRQKLARILKTAPATIQALEKQPVLSSVNNLSTEGRERYAEEILHFPDRPHACPVCGEVMTVRLFHRRDLEDNPILEVKAHCKNCLFIL